MLCERVDLQRKNNSLPLVHFVFLLLFCFPIGDAHTTCCWHSLASCLLLLCGQRIIWLPSAHHSLERSIILGKDIATAIAFTLANTHTHTHTHTFSLSVAMVHHSPFEVTLCQSTWTRDSRTPASCGVTIHMTRKMTEFKGSKYHLFSRWSRICSDKQMERRGSRSWEYRVNKIVNASLTQWDSNAFSSAISGHTQSRIRENKGENKGTSRRRQIHRVVRPASWGLIFSAQLNGKRVITCFWRRRSWELLKRQLLSRY